MQIKQLKSIDVSGGEHLFLYSFVVPLALDTVAQWRYSIGMLLPLTISLFL